MLDTASQVVLWVGWGCPCMGPVLVLDMKWLSETSALNHQDETNLSSSSWAQFWLVRLSVRLRAINAIIASGNYCSVLGQTSRVPAH